MEDAHQQFVEKLIQLGYLKSEAVIEAFKAVDRKDFVTPENKPYAYENRPLSIGYSQTISQPLVVALMLELLDVRKGNKVLEIGSGSGWVTGLLSELTGQPKSKKDGPFVIAIERVKQLSTMAKKNLDVYHFIEDGTALVVTGDGSRGHEDYAPYDRIIASAQGRYIPEEWKQQLKIGGKIVAPVKESIVVLEKRGKNEFEKKEFFGFSFVPLVSK